MDKIQRFKHFGNVLIVVIFRSHFRTAIFVVNVYKSVIQKIIA